MRKNGFTLIELLAVIVILAIIALIATPIILGIINDAREKSNERSAELYLSGVELAIARRNLTEEYNPSKCTITDGNVTCTINDKEVPLSVEVDGKVPTSGTIVFDNNKATSGTSLTFDGFTAEIDENGKVVVESSSNGGNGESTGVVAGTMSICRPVEEQLYATEPLEAGYKYECDVDPNKEGYDQLFYVLSYSDENGNITTDKTIAKSVNLIMDANIRTGGEAVKEPNPSKEQKGTVAWINNKHFLEAGGNQTDWDANFGDSSYGPITAMEYLQTATAGWTNANPQTISTFTVCEDKGLDFICTDDEEMAQTFNTNARLPYVNDLFETGCRAECESCPLWMADYLENMGIQTKIVSGLSGYWMLSSHSFYSNEAWYMDSTANPYYNNNVDDDSDLGVRPVINLSI